MYILILEFSCFLPNSSYCSRGSQSRVDESEPFSFSEEDWNQLNNMIGYKESDDGLSVITNDKVDSLQTSLSICMKHNATKLVDESRECLAELSCEVLDCSIKLYPETKVIDVKLGSYKLSTPNGLLAEVWSSSSCVLLHFLFRICGSLFYLMIITINHLLTSMQSASAYDSLVGTFCYKPFDAKVDWSLVAKASPCYVTVCFCQSQVLTSSKE